MIAIAAMTPSRVIGARGTIPWRLPEDLRFFKQTTLGHIVVMGRATYDSIGKPLPGRENWVLTRGAAIPGVVTLRSPDEIAKPADGRKVFVIGGAQIYAALLPRCDEIYATRLPFETDGDTWFPPFEEAFAPSDTLLETPDFRVIRYLRKKKDA